jgi:hypothetical protein
MLLAHGSVNQRQSIGSLVGTHTLHVAFPHWMPQDSPHHTPPLQAMN